MWNGRFFSILPIFAIISFLGIVEARAQVVVMVCVMGCGVVGHTRKKSPLMPPKLT